jgi:hypothetical protein
MLASLWANPYFVISLTAVISWINFFHPIGMKLRKDIQKHTRTMHLNFFGDSMSSLGDLWCAHMGILGEYEENTIEEYENTSTKNLFFYFSSIFLFFLFVITKYDTFSTFSPYFRLAILSNKFVFFCWLPAMVFFIEFYFCGNIERSSSRTFWRTSKLVEV